FLEPLRFATGFEQLQGGRKYRIVDENGSLHVERTELDDRWKRQYSFTLTPRRLDEFAAMCLYHQTSPESPFMRKKLCTLATADGRITLSDRKLIITQNGSREERMVGSDEEWRRARMDYLQIHLEVKIGARLPARRNSTALQAT